VDAQAALQQARSAREKATKEAGQARKAILETLGQVTDERASRAVEALEQKDWGLDELEALLAGSPTSGDAESTIELLKRLTVLQAPEPTAVAEAVTALRESADRLKAAAHTVAGKSEQPPRLLDDALRFHEAHGDGDCPVCGRSSALRAEWHKAKAAEAESLRETAPDLRKHVRVSDSAARDPASIPR